MTTGLVCETGHGVTQFAPIYDDYIVSDSVFENTKMSGKEIDFSIEKFLSQSTHLDVQIDRDIQLFQSLKTKFGNIPHDSKKKNEFINSSSKNYKNYNFSLKSKLKVNLKRKKC